MNSVSRATRVGTARRTSYLSLSRSPRYSVLFAMPLLLGYEGLAAFLSRPGVPELRNGADALLRAAFTAVAGREGPAIGMAAIILLGVGLVVRDMRRNRDRLRSAVFAGMLAESIVLAAVFGVVIGFATIRLLGSLHTLATLSISPIERTSWPTRLMLSLGAGLYEELFFRVLLVGGFAAAGRIIAGLSARTAGVLAAIVSAFIFSAFHYIGPYGDQFQVQSFVFRFLSGLAFSGLYLLRGFGVTAWTHALYDSMLLL